LIKTDDIFTSRRRQCRFLQKITYFEVFRLEETPLAGLGSFLSVNCNFEAVFPWSYGESLKKLNE
jgi:hypothetical protein